jgi:carboxymethylenebutenolidase
VRDIAQTIRAAVKLPGSIGKVALQGYCLGALMAFITAARHEVDAAVAIMVATQKNTSAKSAACALPC